MNKNKIFKLVIKLIIVLISYGYIYYKFKSTRLEWYDLHLARIDFVLYALLLMPINWMVEAVKWQYLLQDIEQIPIKKSLRGVLVGVTAGLATPNRIGEYLGRTYVLAKQNRVKGTLATILGSLSQVLITLTLGFAGWFLLFDQVHFFEKAHHRPLFMGGLAALLLLLILIFYNLQWIKQLAKWFSINQKYIDEIKFLNKFKAHQLNFVIFLSFSRYMVFLAQYVLLLWSFGLDIDILSCFSAIAVVYLIIVFIPHFAITELGVRSSIAVLVFQFFTNDLHIVAIAASILWLINIATPSIVGSFYLLVPKKQ